MPRILVEYSVVGGKYTSVMNGMDKLKDNLKALEEEQQQEESGGMMQVRNRSKSP